MRMHRSGIFDTYLHHAGTHCRRKVHVANHHRETQLVRAGLAAFKRPLHQKAALELAVLRMLHRQLAGAWAAWIELVAQTRERHALAAEAGKARVRQVG